MNYFYDKYHKNLQHEGDLQAKVLIHTLRGKTINYMRFQEYIKQGITQIFEPIFIQTWVYTTYVLYL